MRLFFVPMARLLLVLLALSCNTVDPSECWVNTSGGIGDNGTIPIGAGVGASASGDFASPPPGGPLDYGGGNNPCVTPPNPAADGDQRALERQELDNPDGAGGLICGTPTDCVNKCVAESKYCWAEHAAHPYKPELLGDLFQCIDSSPPAKAGGSYTCLYRYPNGDACIFCYGSKLGPFTLPAPPPLCVYKSP